MKSCIHQKFFQIIKILFLSLLFNIQPSIIRTQEIKDFDFSNSFVLLIDCLIIELCNDAGSTTEYLVAALNLLEIIMFEYCLKC
jgi:hypothetical protein